MVILEAPFYCGVAPLPDIGRMIKKCKQLQSDTQFIAIGCFFYIRIARGKIHQCCSVGTTVNSILMGFREILRQRSFCGAFSTLSKSLETGILRDRYKHWGVSCGSVSSIGSISDIQFSGLVSAIIGLAALAVTYACLQI
jgi:hypothetical protein